jgi:phosphate transport system ATP-binding protein
MSAVHIVAEKGLLSMEQVPFGLGGPTRRARPLARRSERLRFRVEGLSTWYGPKQILQDVSLDIHDCRITALVGPSGCGKSTFLRCLNRMNDLVSGFRWTGGISLDGHDLRSRDVDVASLRATVGMVFQHPNPFPMSVHDNIGLAVKEHRPGIRKAEVDDVVEESLRQANLWDEVKADLKRSAFALSGGQQQRLCIARALAVKPDFLMLDEPCASLDPVSTARIESLLLDLSADYPIVIVTHNLAQARRISDTMAFFLMGRLLEAGETDTLFATPSLPETREYLEGAFG